MKNKCYKVYKIGKVGSKFHSSICGKNPKKAFRDYQKAGHFTSGDYIVEDKRGKNHRFRH